jgi:hypothetical protein
MRILGWISFTLVVVVMGALGWIAEYAKMPLPYVWLDAPLVAKLADIVLVFDCVAVTVLASLRVDGLTQALAWAGLAIGALAAFHGGLLTWQAASMAHVSDFSVVAPNVAECLLPLGLGLLPFTVVGLLPARQPAPH